MKLSEKILDLRKRGGLSQEELAQRLNVSRQAVSRWEVGSALPDASNILQLSKLFEVSADYLLNDDYESDRDIPAVKNTENTASKKMRHVIAACISLLGLLGNFILYILSRIIEVMVPHVMYQNGEKVYYWDSSVVARSYKYFIQTYDLEFLAIVFWGLLLAGQIYMLISSGIIQRVATKQKERRQRT